MKRIGASKSSARSAALRGNTNASKTGAKAAALGTLIPMGNLIGGAVLGAKNKSQDVLTQHTRYATGINAAGGAIYGGLIGGPGGALAGAAIYGATGYGASKAGQYIGKKISKIK
jgi:hypothetical protein